MALTVFCPLMRLQLTGRQAAVDSPSVHAIQLESLTGAHDPKAGLAAFSRRD